MVPIRRYRLPRQTQRLPSNPVRSQPTPAAAMWSQPHGVPNGYCPHHSTGVGCPAWGAGLMPQEASATS
jgi:hypothetical protein